MQYDWYSPLPTLPRNWCNCANPNLSAFSTTIILEFGTFTPTSITVVAIKIWISPFLNLSIISSFSFGFIFPYTHSTLYSLNVSFWYFSASSITDCKPSISSFSSTNGHTIYACLPSVICFLIKLFTLSSIFFLTAYVSIFFLFGGSSSIIDISKSPYNINANVLGIGVADIAITSGFFPLDAIVPLCFTPKRCCSSVTTNPKFLNTTFSSNIACVPINISISPFCSFSNISVFFFFVTLEINSSVLIPSSSNIPWKLSKCWLASIAVGAIIVAW